MKIEDTFYAVLFGTIDGRNTILFQFLSLSCLSYFEWVEKTFRVRLYTCFLFQLNLKPYINVFW